MKLVLLGCNGFIGSELIPRLMQSGHSLTVVGRKNKNNLNEKIKSCKTNYLRLDLSDEKSWTNQDLIQTINECDGVINLVGEPIAEKRWSKEYKQKLIDSRIKTTNNLIKSLSIAKKVPKVLINGSAIGYYGFSRNKIFDERSSEGKDFLAKLCKDWENAANNNSNQIRLIILRLGLVMDPDGGALAKMLPVFRMGLGGPIGEGNQWISWISRKDICLLIEQIIGDDSITGVINCVTPNPIKMKDFAKKLGLYLKRPSLLKVPSFILKILLGDGASVVLEGQKVTSNSLTKMNYEFNHLFIDDLLKEL